MGHRYVISDADWDRIQSRLGFHRLLSAVVSRRPESEPFQEMDVLVEDAGIGKAKGLEARDVGLELGGALEGVDPRIVHVGVVEVEAIEAREGALDFLGLLDAIAPRTVDFGIDRVAVGWHRPGRWR